MGTGLHKKIAGWFGYTLTRRYNAAMPTAMDTLMEVIGHCGIKLVLDVGANFGQFGKQLRQQGYSETIHSFEPVEVAYQQLAETCRADSRWHAHQRALGATQSVKTLHIARASDLSSFHPPNAYGQNRFKNFDVVAKEEVQVETVDNFLSTLGAHRESVLLKMDTQGYDLEVFRGARNSLKNIVAIQSEISFKPIYEGMPSYLDAFKLYEEHGFRVVGLHPISRDKNLPVIEMDCIFINDGAK